MEEHVAAEIRNPLDVHRRLRLAGIGLLVVGAVLLSAGNLVG